MAYTFGGATSDVISWSVTPTIAATGRASLICGWWRPTTLTAGRKLIGVGATVAVQIDTTTSELRLKTDNTTDGEWTTSGVNLAVDEWKFIAVMTTTLNTSSTEAWRVWAGDVTTPPVECTCTEAVASSGNFTGSSTFCLGNHSPGASVSFQGEIGNGRLYHTNAGSSSASIMPFKLAAYGAITNDEAAFVYERFVLPAWRDEPWNVVGTAYSSGLWGSTENSALYMWNLDYTLPVILVAQDNSAGATHVLPGITGATPSLIRTPVPRHHQALHPLPSFGN